MQPTLQRHRNVIVRSRRSLALVHINIPVGQSSLKEIKGLKSAASHRGIEMPFHLSLSGPLKVDPKTVNALGGDLKRALKDCSALSLPLAIPLGPQLAALGTQTGKYAFLVMMVPANSAAATRIAQVIRSVDKVLDRFDLEMYSSRYGRKKRFHVSVGWCILGEFKSDLHRVLRGTCCTQVICPVQEIRMDISFPSRKRDNRLLWTP
eukprot:gene18005-24414_t